MSGLRAHVGGRLVDRDSIRLASGLRLGDGVYETLRTYEGRPFRAEEHVGRLLAGAAALELDGLPSEVEVMRALSDVLAASGPSSEQELVIRIILSSAGESAELMVLTDPLEPTPTRFHESGMRAALGDVHSPVARSTPGPPGLVKWLSHGPNALTLRRARRVGRDEALLVDAEGRAVEGSRSNLLVAVGGTVLAPGPAAGALDGVTRRVVVESARGRGLHVEDRAIDREEFSRASEAMLTSSLLEVAPLVQVDSMRIGTGTPGVLFRRLRESYLELVERECGSRGPG
jgi:branched-subunit amino acid aminotransferase/4-amino-4-deoxychorismate lyase